MTNNRNHSLQSLPVANYSDSTHCIRGNLSTSSHSLGCALTIIATGDCQ